MRIVGWNRGFKDGARCSEIEIELIDPRVAAALQLSSGTGS